MKRILVGYDGSAGGQRALERAIEEAEKTRSRITVVSVLNVPLDPDVPRNFGTLDDISDREGEALGPPPEGFGRYVMPGNNFHVYDMALFWANVRADVATRTKAYLAR